MSGFLALADVKAYLAIPAGDTSRDVVLQRYVDGAAQQVTYIVGDITPTSYTETYTVPGAAHLALRHAPVISVDALFEYVGPLARTLTLQPPGATLDNYGFSLDLPEAGVITRRSAMGLPMLFLGTTVVVSYTAGRLSVPADVELAALEDVRGLWTITQQGGRPGFGSQPSETWNVGPMKLYPRLAALLEGASRTPGIA